MTVTGVGVPSFTDSSSGKRRLRSLLQEEGGKCEHGEQQQQQEHEQGGVVVYSSELIELKGDAGDSQVISIGNNPVSWLEDYAAVSVINSEAAASHATRRLAQAAGNIQVDSRISTLSQSDSDAVIARVNNGSRQQTFKEALSAVGLNLVPGSVAVRASSGGNAGGSGAGSGTAMPNFHNPQTQRIIIIVCSVVGALLVLSVLGCFISWCLRSSRRRRQQTPAARYHFPPPAHHAPYGTNPFANPVAGYRPPQPAAGFRSQPPPANGAPVGGFTVAGQSFATRKEAEDYAMALAMSRSMDQQQGYNLGPYTAPPAVAGYPYVNGGYRYNHPNGSRQ